MKELFQLSCRCTKLKCGVIWAFVVMSAPGPWRKLHLGDRSRRLPRPMWKAFARGMQRAAGSLRGCSFLSCRGHSCQVRVLYPTLGFFFCKVAGKNPWSRVAFFWAYFTKYGCLFGKSDKQLRFFIYVRRILQYIDWHSVCSQLIANQCNNIRAVE